MSTRINKLLWLLVLATALGALGAKAESIIFNEGVIRSSMTLAGAPLSNATNQWGLWAVRAMPIVGGSGLYTIDSGFTSQPGWGVSAPNGIFGMPPYTPTNHAWFWDASGSEVPGNPANPLYLIINPKFPPGISIPC